MKKTYKNRYGNNITFELLESNGLVDVVKVSGFEYYRTGFNTETNQVNFFDPEGGPFISVGQDISDFFKSDTPMMVQSIIDSNGGFLLQIEKV
jgi:hypothetical protein